jgi:hypothetical protein
MVTRGEKYKINIFLFYKPIPEKNYLKHHLEDGPCNGESVCFLGGRVELLNIFRRT